MVNKADSRAPQSRAPQSRATQTALPQTGVPGSRAPKAEVSPTWASRDREGVYRELEHPADLLLEITGRDLATLFENALFAFYDQVAELGGFGASREMVITASGTSPPDALRALLNEALYRFETEGFVAVGAQVAVETAIPPEGAGLPAGEARPEPGGVEVVARLWGEKAAGDRHTLTAEIKAVTYHRLALDLMPDGAYRATVLFDV